MTAHDRQVTPLIGLWEHVGCVDVSLALMIPMSNLPHLHPISTKPFEDHRAGRFKIFLLQSPSGSRKFFSCVLNLCSLLSPSFLVLVETMNSKPRTWECW